MLLKNIDLTSSVFSNYLYTIHPVFRSGVASMRKIKKLFRNPGVFFRDYFNKRYPVIRNEIQCPEYEEDVLIRHDTDLERAIVTTDPIDVVYTWVNSDDPVWKEKCGHYRRLYTQSHSEIGRHAMDVARFDDHNEIYYSIKSVIEFLPWVRTIFVVTDQQIPDVLSLSSKIKIIDHREIIDQQYLPTFNSHVIEAHIHNIPELSENFIYFNDDVFVARPLLASHFFNSNGIASLFISGKSLAAMEEKGINTPTLSASLSSGSILKRDYNINVDRSLVHTYVPLRKSMFRFAWTSYENEIRLFLKNKFRTNNDLNLATFFVPWLMYLRGKAVPRRDICYYFNIRSFSAVGHYRALHFAKVCNIPPHSFCANDFNTERKSTDNYKEHLLSALSSYFDMRKNSR